MSMNENYISFLVDPRKRRVRQGDRFGALVVVGPEFHYRDNSWKAVRACVLECDCGEHKVASTGHLKAGNVQSCGCMATQHEWKVTGKKTCAECNRDRPVSEFGQWDNGCYSSYCEDCWRSNRRAYAKNKKARRRIAGVSHYRRNIWSSRAADLNRKAGESFLSAADLRNVWAREQGCCFYCGHKFPELCESSTEKNHAQFDHVIPGLNRADNLVLACRTCNVRKSDNTLDTLEWFALKIREHLTRTGDESSANPPPAQVADVPLAISEGRVCSASDCTW